MTSHRPAALFAVALTAPLLLLALACDAKGVKETRTAMALAVREVQGLADDATAKGIQERELKRSEDPLDWPPLAATAIQRFQSSPEARMLKNPYEAAKPVFVASPEGSQPGTVYLDATAADSGTIMVTAVFKDGTRVKRETASVKLNLAARPRKIEVNTDAMPAAPGL